MADDDRATEAKHLAEDAKAASKQGDKDEAEFLADAAKNLDPKAAKSVLKKS